MKWVEEHYWWEDKVFVGCISQYIRPAKWDRLSNPVGFFTLLLNQLEWEMSQERS